jgi:PAS domain S-box-containing protein
MKLRISQFYISLSGILILVVLYLFSIYNYLLFHTLAEFISISIAFTLFLVAWNTYEYNENQFFLFLGFAYFFVASVDLFHIMSYPGMPIFKKYGNITNLTTSFWIYARYMESLSLLSAFIFLKRKVDRNKILILFSFVTITGLILIFAKIFPVCHIEGQGLTIFKITSEYIISTILITAGFLIVKFKRSFDKKLFIFMLLSIITTVISEMCFTFPDPYGFANLIGHYAKIISFYFIYKGIIETGLKRPYSFIFKNLSDSEQNLRLSEAVLRKNQIKLFSTLSSIINSSYSFIYSVDREYRYTSFNQGHISIMKEIYGAEIEIGHSLLDYITVSEDREKLKYNIDRVLSGEKIVEETYSGNNRISRKFFYILYSPIKLKTGDIIGAAAIAQDMTDRRQMEEALSNKTALLEAQINSSNDGILVVDMHGKKILQNQRTIDLWKIPRHIADNIDDNVQVQHVMNMTKYPEQFVDKVTYLYRHPDDISHDEVELTDGTVLDRYSAPVLGKDGQNYGRIWSFHDITRRKQAEQELLAKHELLNSIYATIPVGIVMVDRSGKIVEANPQAENVLGLKKEEITQLLYNTPDWKIAGLDGQPFPDDRLPFNRVQATGQSVKDIQHAIQWPDGRRVFLSINAAPVFDKEGRFNGMIASIEDITERKEAEEALRISESGLKEAQHLGRLGSWDWDAVTDTITWSEEYYRIYGLDPTRHPPGYEEHLKVYMPESAALLDAAVKRNMETGEPYELDLEIADPKGQCRWITARSETKRDAEGRIIGLRGTAQDITLRKQTEEALLESESKYRTVVESSLVGVYIIQDDLFRFVNNRWCEIYGYTRDEVVDKLNPVIDLTPVDDKKIVEENLRKRLTGELDHLEYTVRAVKKNGEIITVRILGSLMIYNGRQAVSGTVIDITNSKRAEEALALRNRINEIFLRFPGKEMYWEILQIILELTKSPYGIFAYLDEAGSLVVPSLTREVWQECQMTNKSIIFPRETWGSSIWGKIITEKKSIYLNEPFNVPKGHIPIKRALGVPIIYQGVVIGHILVANRETDYNRQDIDLLEDLADSISPTFNDRLQTERQEHTRRQSEEEIRHLKNYLANIIDSMPSILVGLDQKANITQWNKQAEKMTGIPTTEAIGKHISRLIPEFSSFITSMRNEINNRCPASLEKLLIEKEGERSFYDLILYPLITNGVEGSVLRIENVTERTRIQELMIQTEKMMSLGGLAAGMAHEINNPLGIITQAAQNIERRVSSDLPANRKIAEEAGISIDGLKTYFEKRRIPDFINSIREASLRATKIITNMLRFSSSSGTAMQEVSPANIMEQALELAANDYDLKKKYDFRNIEIIRDYSQDMPEVPMVWVEIEQVVLNLIKNAAQAMILNPPGLKPRITLRLRKEERYALIEVEDNGPGMEENIRRRVFEPFFTTKEPGIGTGLGLSVSYMIVTQNHKGLIEADSTPGRGACFKVRLPLLKESIHY